MISKYLPTTTSPSKVKTRRERATIHTLTLRKSAVGGVWKKGGERERAGEIALVPFKWDTASSLALTVGLVMSTLPPDPLPFTVQYSLTMVTWHGSHKRALLLVSGWGIPEILKSVRLRRDSYWQVFLCAGEVVCLGLLYLWYASIDFCDAIERQLHLLSSKPLMIRGVDIE